MTKADWDVGVKAGAIRASEALRGHSGASPKMAAQRLLRLLYPNSKPESPKKKDEANRDVRNEEIRRRYEAGERVVDPGAGIRYDHPGDLPYSTDGKTIKAR